MNNYEFVVNDTMAKFKSVMQKHENPRIAYSGGSDSDIVMKLAELAGFDITSVFYDTGIEYQATKDHVDLQIANGRRVDKIRAYMPIPTSNKKYGHPLINKRVSDYIGRLQSHNFDFQKEGSLGFDELYKKYPTSKTSLSWWCNQNQDGGRSQYNISNNPYLKEFIIENGIGFRVANKCCDGAKKRPMRGYAKENGVDLVIMGVRKAEGGSRVSAYKSCYTKTTADSYHIYMPLFFWPDSIKSRFKTEHGVVYSDIYNVYGLHRGGCTGCPLGRDFLGEMNSLKQNEPKLHRGIHAIFKKPHEFTIAYKEFAAKMRVGSEQLKFDIF